MPSAESLQCEITWNDFLLQLHELIFHLIIQLVNLAFKGHKIP